MSEDAAFICIKVSEAPEGSGIDGSRIFSCHGCHEDVYVAPTTMRMTERMKGQSVHYFCFDCAKPLLKPGEKVHITDEQIEEVIENRARSENVN